MYPLLHDFLNDLFGTNLKLPFPMFGIWVALAFIAAYYFFSLELKRKEGEGLIHSVLKKRIVGEKMKPADYIVQFAFGFIVGFKGLEFILHYGEFVSNPPDMLLSTRGNWLGGLSVALIFTYLKYREKSKSRLKIPEEIDEEVHPYELVGNMTLIAAIGGILGAKLFHNLENLNEFMNDPLDALLSFSGLSIFGGLIIGGLAVVLYAVKSGLKAIHVIDACAPALLLAYGVGRIGCQLAGDGDWGLPNDREMPEFLSFLPSWVWSYDYPNNVLGVNLQADFIRMGYESVSGKAWPTPLYESAMSLVLFALLWSVRKQIRLPGIVFSIYLMLIGLERFFIEKIRINPKYHFLGMQATQAEIISILSIAAGLAMLIYLLRRQASNNLSTL